MSYEEEDTCMSYEEERKDRKERGSRGVNKRRKGRMGKKIRAKG